jgi:serine protease Do
MNGEVIGITSAKYSGLTSSGATIEGIGFAIPMDDVLGMLEDLKEYGYITGGYLGVSVSDVDKQTAEMYGLPFGALIHSVEPNSCAAKAGMKKQDIITNVGGYDIDCMSDLSKAMHKFKPGQKTTITVWRSGQYITMPIEFDEKPAA